MPFKLQGDTAMRDKIRRLGAEFPSRIERVLTVEAEEVMTISKRDYVPVDLGALRSSGKVGDVVRHGAAFTISLEYGDTAAPYALTVHEHPSGYDPPTWRGKRIVFSPTGRGPKYLEIPLMERVTGMAQRIAGELEL